MHSLSRKLLLLLLCLATGPALPAVARDAWSLGGAVPDSVYLYVHTVRNPENQFLEEYWAKVWETFKTTGLLDEIKSLITSRMPEDQRSAFEVQWGRVADLVGQVDWEGLFGNEFVYAQAMRFPSPSHLYMFRMEQGIADKNAAGLKAILLEIKDLIAKLTGLNEEDRQPGLAFTESERLGAKVCTLSYADELTLSLAQRGDIIIVAAESNTMPLRHGPGEPQEGSPDGDRLIDQALRLLDGDKSVKRLIDRPNYRQAMAALPAAESERFFFNAATLFTSLDRGLAWIKQSLPEPAGADSKPWLRAVRKGLDHLGFIDCSASVETTEGFSKHCYSVTLMTPEAKDKPFYRAICGTPPVQRFDKYIPKTAVGFSVTSGIDWMALYEAVTVYIHDELPGGAEILESWNGFQEAKGFRLDKDLLSWLGSEMISVSMKPPIPSPFGGQDWVLLVQVKDQAKAEQAVGSGVAQLTGLLGGGQTAPLTTQPAKSPALEGFQSLMFPPMAMFLRPVYGVADNYLIIGSSEKAITRCLKTASGEAPSVLKNKRYIKEGLAPKGPVTSVSFADKSKMGQEMAQLMGMLGMGGAMLQTQSNEEVAKVLGPIFGLVQKLAPVVAQINFYKSEASVTTFDGKMFRTEKVTHYKKPRPPQAPEDKAAPASAAVRGGELRTAGK